MLTFCTLFDINYLIRGLALYESLEELCESFHLYIFAFDDQADEILRKLSLKNATIISLREFENEKLLAIKSSRTAVEYCWTSTPSTIEYVLDNYGVECCTYLDADLYFFASPSPLLAEMGDKSVLITEHWYTPAFDKTQTSGRFCVQFMTFKNTSEGRKVLSWWRDACLDWCYAKYEDGKLGDQKYLDDWPERFFGVHICQHLGGGVAPWNVQQYEPFSVGGAVHCRALKNGETFPLVFFHYHALQFLGASRVNCSAYPLSSEVISYIYYPYIKRLLRMEEKIRKRGLLINPTSINIEFFLKRWLRKVLFLKHVPDNVLKFSMVEEPRV